MANFNNLNKRGYTLDINNTKNVSKYEEALGTTSIQNALSILLDNEKSEDEKAGAINDLIMIRLILSGKIQFRSSKFGGLIKTTVGKGFEGIEYRNLDGIYKEIDKLVNDLDENPGKEPEIFKGFLRKLITTFVTAVGIGTAFHALVSWIDLERNIRQYIYRRNDIYDEMHKMMARGDSTTQWSTQTPEYLELQAEKNLQQSKIQEMSNPKYFGILFGKQLLNQGTIFAPVIIGVLSSMYVARSMTRTQNEKIRVALIKMIDSFMVTNEEILRILNENGTVPKVFENDGPAMALYNRYIRAMYKKYDDIKKKKNENRRVEIETNTNTTVLNFGKFLTSGLGDDCGICTKPLSSAGMPVVKLDPCDHKFHQKCINDWIKELNKTEREHTCPICRGEFTGTSLVATTGGTRKKRSNKRKKSKTRSMR
jgi:hypothetical protein